MSFYFRRGFPTQFSRCHIEESMSVLFIIGLITLATGGPSTNVVGFPISSGVRTDPYFMDDQPVKKNLTLLAGQTAYLECNVRNLGANKVSWIRHEDVQILAVGGQTFTSDSRFLSVIREEDGKFTLLIRKILPKDAGTYECQISTKPTRSIFVHLQIKTPKIEILSESHLHVEKDSGLNLTCIVSGGGLNEYGQQWPKIFWFKDSQPIDNSVGGRGRIFESVYDFKSDFPRTISNLLVSKATIQDSGNYTCSSSALSNYATVKVHILIQGESPNAWKTNEATNKYKYLLSHLLFFVIIAKVLI